MAPPAAAPDAPYNPGGTPAATAAAVDSLTAALLGPHTQLQPLNRLLQRLCDGDLHVLRVCPLAAALAGGLRLHCLLQRLARCTAQVPLPNPPTAAPLNQHRHSCNNPYTACSSALVTAISMSCGSPTAALLKQQHHVVTGIALLTHTACSSALVTAISISCAVRPPSGCASMRANISVIMMSSSRGVLSLLR